MPTTDDIRAAAERLRFAAFHPHSPIYGSDLVPLVDEVTKHILAAHPADDAEPVTWKDGWPIGDRLGVFVVELRCKDVVAIKIEEWEGDDDSLLNRCASDNMDGVCFRDGDDSELTSYWGHALRHYGPIPSCTGDRTDRITGE